MKWILLALILTISLARADGPDRDYIHAYNLIQQADVLSKSGNQDAATHAYREAYDELKKIQSVYPNWNETAVKYRMEHLVTKLQATQPTNAVPVAKASPSAQPESNPFLDKVRRLETENVRLNEDLKRASQSASASAEEIAKLQEQLAAVQKERDSLATELEQVKKARQTEKKIAAPQSNNHEKELEQLRARLESLEAHPTPFTPEELALRKKPAPEIAPGEVKPAKKSRELPPGAGTLVAQAERAFAAHQFAEAEKKYREVLRQDEKNIYILGNLAATQLEMNHIEDAEKNIKTALENDPDDAFSLTLLGIIKFRQDKIDEALDLLSRSAKINPQNAETQNYLGITLSQKGQRVAAEAALRKAVQLQPNYAGAHHNLAVIYATQKPPFLELARWHYERALSLGHEKNPELEKLLSDAK